MNNAHKKIKNLSAEEQEELYKQQLSYWKQQLQNAPSSLDLSVSKQCPETLSSAKAKCDFSFPSSLMEKLRVFQEEQQVTLFTLLLSVFQVLLYRYSEQLDIVVGTTISSDPQKETEKMSGSFANNLALRTKLKPSMSFQKLLQNVKKTISEAMRNCDFPFERLVQELNIPSPIFQIVYLHHDSPQEAELAAVEKVSISEDTARFDIVLETVDRCGEIFGWFEYNTQVFDVATMENITKHFLTLLDSVCMTSESPISLLPMLTLEEVNTLQQLRNTHQEFLEQPLHLLFQEQAAKTPTNVAIECQEQSITYQDLNNKVNQYAHLLRRKIKPGDCVGIYMNHCCDLVVAILAVMKAGGTYVPLTTDDPLQRTQTLAIQSNISVIITCQGLLQEQCDLSYDFVVFGCDNEAIYSTENPESQASLEDIAYIIFTSGSTGIPKGIKISHCALSNFLQAMQQQFQPGENSRFLALTTIASDVSLLEIFLPLVSGGRTVIAPVECRNNTHLLIQQIEKVNFMQATPTTWSLLVTDNWSGKSDLIALSGGEQLSQELADVLRPKCQQLWNMYGPSEATVCCTTSQITDSAVNIGYPIANTAIYVLNHDQQYVPMEMPGEIYVSGKCLASGYLNSSDHASFVEIDGCRAYRTGDFAKYNSEKALVFLGRRDRQVKVQGFRVEPEEIEKTLQLHPKVRRAIVHPWKEESSANSCSNSKVLCAYILAEKIDEKELREFLQESLPSYMIPSYFIAIQKVPLTPHKKIDYKALPLPENLSSP